MVTPGSHIYQAKQNENVYLKLLLADVLASRVLGALNK